MGTGWWEPNGPSSPMAFWSPSTRAGRRTHVGWPAPGLSWDAAATRVAVPEAPEGAPQLFLQETTSVADAGSTHGHAGSSDSLVSGPRLGAESEKTQEQVSDGATFWPLGVGAGGRPGSRAPSTCLFFLNKNLTLLQPPKKFWPRAPKAVSTSCASYLNDPSPLAGGVLRASLVHHC